MSKVRVFELAKELNVTSQDVISRAVQAGIKVDNHLSQVDTDTADHIKQLFLTPVDGEVIEERVNKTVIRRKRVRAAGEGPSAVDVAPPPPPRETPPPPPPRPVLVGEPEATPAHLRVVKEVPAEVEPIAVAPVIPVEEPAAEPEVPPHVEAAEVEVEPAAPPVVPEAPSPVRDIEPALPTPPPLIQVPIAVAVAGVVGAGDIAAEAPASPAKAPEAPPPREPDRSAPARIVRGVRVDPHGRPTETRAVVVAAPPPDFRPPSPPGAPRPYVGRSGPPPGSRRPEAGGFSPPFTPPPAAGMDARVRPAPPVDKERERVGLTDRDDKKKKRGAGRVVLDKGRAGAWNPRRGLVEEEATRLRRGGRKGPKKARAGKTLITTPRAAKRIVRIEDTITVGDLAQALSIKASELIRALMKQGLMVGINHVLDLDTASLIAEEFEYKVENVGFDIADYVPDVDESDEDLETRSPVVTVMGHVDHGKTSLLDHIRSSRVASQEAGGITQHIGAYSVQVNDRRVVFLDTPGHEAFTEMRARGAQVTDIVILVVAADDGVMPQTIEAINHAKAAEVPIVVAVTKIDKNNARPDRVLQQLAEHGLQPVEWGGQTEVVKVSSHTGEGIDDLLELLALQADVLELTANPSRPAQGIVIEARLDRGRGPVASVIIQNGTLRVGDYVVTGQVYGRVRALLDDSGKNLVKEAGPSMPVQILGLNGVPNASDPIFAVDDEKKARTIAEHRATKEREKELGKTSRVSLEDLYEQIRTGEVQELRVIVKADVHGSVEAIKGALLGIKHDKVAVKIIHDGVGGILKSDVNLANASGAIVIGFNVRAEADAKLLAEQEGVEIKTYTIIYDIVDDVKKAMEGLLAPTIEERELGRAEVRQTFAVPKIGTVAGCYVTSGLVRRNAKVRLFRENVLVWSGGIASLRRFKNDVREVADGYECGIRLEGYNDLKEGDLIEAYETVEVAQLLE